MRTLYSNSVETFFPFEVFKDQLVFIPKEESQMFQSLDENFISSGDALTESEEMSEQTFQAKTAGLHILPNSSFTATDYIGASYLKVPTTLNETFIDFKLYNTQSNLLTDLYTPSELNRIRFIKNGLYSLRFPVNKLNTILTDSLLIEANDFDNIKQNLGEYVIIITPKYIQGSISNIIDKKHIRWEDLSSNDNGFNLPIDKRRTVYQINKSTFQNTLWSFETGTESGRLFGSVVEVWNSSLTILKETKLMTENRFNFSNSNSFSEFVLYPDNFGFDSEQIVTGDIVRIYPRETSFKEVSLFIEYKHKNSRIEKVISYLLNDVVRDLQHGLYEVYDNTGVTLDDNDIPTGKVEHRYQLSQTDKYEIRKKIKL